MGVDPSQHVQYGVAGAPTRRVFLTYTAAVSAGYPVCYDHDNINTYQNVTTANVALSTAANSRRLCVEKPSAFNNLHFAGVISKDYAADTAGQWIDIYPPGTICNIRLASTANADFVVTGYAGHQNTGQMLTFGVGEWYFKKGGYPGSGSAIVMQVISGTAPSVPTTCQAELQIGEQSGGYQEMLVYSGLVSVMVSAANAITRGGVTEILSVLDGTGATKAAITTHYTLSDGDYVGQQKLILVDTSVGYSVFELIICIPKATTVAATGVAAPQVVSTLARAASRVLISTVKQVTHPAVCSAKWNGWAWEIHANAVNVS